MFWTIITGRELTVSNNSENRRRVFADVVTIDAWHKDFSNECVKADLHTDVVFGTGRVGGDAESSVRFRLSVRRAEIIVIIPETEPLIVDKASVSRDAPQRQVKMTRVLEQTTQANAQTTASGTISAAGLSGSASVGGAAQADISAKEKFESSGDVSLMLVTQSKTGDNSYRWLVEPHPKGMKTLEGRPWDAGKPRLALVDQRKDRSKGIPPTVRVEVRCRREDLVVDDLRIKNDAVWDRVKRKVGFKNRLAAAESYIRDRLLSEDLEFENIDDPFGVLTLANVTAENS
jgi:hypothetical protein